MTNCLALKVNTYVAKALIWFLQKSRIKYSTPSILDMKDAVSHVSVSADTGGRKGRRRSQEKVIDSLLDRCETERTRVYELKQIIKYASIF